MPTLVLGWMECGAPTLTSLLLEQAAANPVWGWMKACPHGHKIAAVREDTKAGYSKFWKWKRVKT